MNPNQAVRITGDTSPTRKRVHFFRLSKAKCTRLRVGIVFVRQYLIFSRDSLMEI